MLRVRALLSDLRLGDRFTIVTDDPLDVQTLTELPATSPEGYGVRFATEQRGPWFAIDTTLEVILHASAGDVSARVAEALGMFDSTVIAEVLRMFCPCGLRGCGKHR